ncbi:MAG: hypothetical protein U9R25_11910 [Chloroflexota bacterium]|nr:hypothetical protein [Chloroflexota bacterium]
MAATVGDRYERDGKSFSKNHQVSGLVLVRVPVMYDCIGEKPLNIGGLSITCPTDMHDALMLIRSDVNRYVTVLLPFSVLGLRALIASVSRLAARLSPFARS